MNKPKKMLKAIGTLLFSTLLLPSCSDMDEYFEVPSWIEGSIYEKLEADGHYTQFLRGAERAGFAPMLDGKSILTVMAPTDEAMSTYVQQTYGKQSIDELSDAELRKLIGFHILYYSFDKEKLTNFRPQEGDGATEEQKLTNAGLYYKFRTKSQDPIEQANDTAAVYHLERYVPVFSPLMFRTKGIAAKENYEYFYPQTGWNGDDGFQVANANVTEYTDIAKNGYIYKVDRVLRPLETIYTEMKQAGKYGKFLAFYDSFRNYQLDEDLTLEYGNGRQLYQVVFRDGTTGVSLPPIASEWPVTDYSMVTALAYNAYSIFAPTDDALEDFFDDYWRVGGYEVLDSVSPTLVSTLLRHSIYSQSIVFPEEVEKGLILDAEQQPIRFNTAEVPQQDRIICSNGVLYGCNVLTPPAMFNSVTGPAYQYQKYSAFQHMVAESGMQSTLCNDAVRYIMLYPSNEQLEQSIANIRVVDNVLVAGPQGRNMGNALKQTYVYAHVAAPIDGNTTLPQTGKAVLRALSPDQNLYWYVKDGRITNSIKHNELLRHAANTTTEDDVFVPFHALDYRGDVDGWTNGHAYAYDDILMEGNFDNVNDSRLVRQMYALRNDATTDFYGWINLLNKGGLFAASSQTFSFMIENCLMFIPVTKAVEQAILDGRIPGTTASEGATVGADDFFSHVEVSDPEALEYYVRQYFLPVSTAEFSNFPYIGWGENTETYGGIITLQQSQDAQNNILSSRMNIYDDGSAISIQATDHLTGRTSQRVRVTADYDFFPFVYEDAAAHFIEDVL